jgi:septal ring factor EnvC (AmiA/AmiB activator)
MIKFGSGTGMIMPDGAEINVKPGDRVKAGESVIGTVK